MPNLLEVISQEVNRDRSPICRGLKKGADEGGEPAVDFEGGSRKSGIIRGASLIAKGEALGHRMWIDEVMLAQVVEAGNSTKNGVKVRFAHPSMSGDGIGSYLGKAKNLRLANDRVVGDIHFSPSSRETPDGDLGKYVMGLAKNDPDAFGMSIVFERDRKAEREFSNSHQQVNEDGDSYFVSPDEKNKKNYRHTRLAALLAADFVDEPAANPDGVFHRGPSQEIIDQAESVAAYALGLTETIPGDSGGLSADRVRGFLSRFLESRGLTLQLNKKDEDMSLKTDETNTKVTDTAEEKPDAKGTKSELSGDSKPESKAEKADENEDVDPKALGAAEERKRSKQIRVLCEMSGCPEKADKFIDAEFSVEETREAIANLLEKKNKVISEDDADPAEDKQKSLEAKYRKEYAEQKHIHQQLGISESDYVEQRLIEDGHKEEPAIMPGLNKQPETK